MAEWTNLGCLLGLTRAPSDIASSRIPGSGDEAVTSNQQQPATREPAPILGRNTKEAPPASSADAAPMRQRFAAPHTRGDFEPTVARLVAKVRNWQFRDGTLLRLSEPVPETDPLLWLQANPLDTRIFWRNRERTVSIAGIGTALELVVDSAADHGRLLGQINTIVDGCDAAFLGGLAFAGHSGEDEWSSFPAARFVLPALELRQRDGRYNLAVNLLAQSRGEFMRMKTHLLELLYRIRWTLDAGRDNRPACVSQRVDELDSSVCRRHIDEILQNIARKELNKAVLARRVEIRLSAPVAPFRLLERWCRTNPGSFTFAMERGGDLFMGCTPERLYRRSGRDLLTESLAGTVRRGTTLDEDRTMEATLLNDPKLVHEHDLVTRFMHAQISPWVTDTASPAEVGILKLDRIQHRYLPIHATLKPGVLDAHLLRALHPTPAICGFPRTEAQVVIKRLESVQRGWYSGPFGIVSPEHSEFAVAIRSALINKDRIFCYSGVGIVEGSDPEAEWNELESKIESFLSVLEC